MPYDDFVFNENTDSPLVMAGTAKSFSHAMSKRGKELLVFQPRGMEAYEENLF